MLVASFLLLDHMDGLPARHTAIVALFSKFTHGSISFAFWITVLADDFLPST
jgi:hypothetical protein